MNGISLALPVRAGSSRPRRSIGGPSLRRADVRVTPIGETETAPCADAQLASDMSRFGCLRIGCCLESLSWPQAFDRILFSAHVHCEANDLVLVCNVKHQFGRGEPQCELGR